MKLSRLLPLVLLLTTLPGCALLPGRVEFFQRKVKPVPELSESGREHQRQAADYVARKSRETVDSAVSTGASLVVLNPAKDAAEVAGSLSDSLGTPHSQWNAPATNITATLQRDEAKLRDKVDAYAEKVQKDVGKEIEGTGFFQMGYFTMWGIILGVGALIWFALKIWGTINPVVGIGTNIVGRLSSTVLRRGFTQVVSAGESFKEYLDKSPQKTFTIDEVRDLFVRAQRENQDTDLQEHIKTLTK